MLSSANGLILGERRPRSLPALVLAILCLCLLQNHGGHPGIPSDRRHNLHFQACSFFVAHMGPHHSFPHSDSGQVRASPAGSTTTFVDSALTSTEELGLSRFSQPVKQNSQTVTQNRDSLKDEYEFDSELFTHDYYEYEQGQKHILVRGRLKRNINFWRDIGASDFILDAIVNGYKVLLYSLPPQSFSHNNLSA